MKKIIDEEIWTDERIREVSERLDFEKYEKQGVDISLLFSNLKRTPTQRLENNREFLDFKFEIQKNSTDTEFITPTNLFNFFSALDREKVKFVASGTIAAIAYGSRNFKFDIDICYERSVENVQALVRALKPSNPKLRTRDVSIPFLFDDKNILSGLNFSFDTDWGDISLLGEIIGIGGYHNLLARAEKIKFHDCTIGVISLEDLIKSKQVAARTSDKLHLLELEALRDAKQNNY